MTWTVGKVRLKNKTKQPHSIVISSVKAANSALTQDPVPDLVQAGAAKTALKGMIK